MRCPLSPVTALCQAQGTGLPVLTIHFRCDSIALTVVSYMLMSLVLVKGINTFYTTPFLPLFNKRTHKRCKAIEEALLLLPILVFMVLL